MTLSILPHQLPDALADAPAGIAMLSLDCFDTLLWRDVHAPADVFADLGNGATPQQRIWAESHARSRQTLRKGSNEASIEQIYSALLPGHEDAARASAMAAELEAEARHCYGFAPTVALMRAAKAAGLSIAVVSDTYLSRDQLVALITAAAGDEVAALIDHVFCSSEYGVSKAEGLFKHVLRKTRLAPDRILHIGDNKKADFTAARALGIHGVHLVQFGEEDQQRLRLEAAVAAIVNGNGASVVPPHQPHRAAHALTLPAIADPAERLGFSALGPVLHAFGRWLADEAAALSRPGARTHILFLMRDGYLPQRVFEALDTGLSATSVEISRFTATASAFTDENAVADHLEIELECTDLAAIAKQLLFTEDETAALLRKLPTRGRERAFAAAVRQPTNLRKVLGRSRAFAERLTRYVAQQVPARPGDTLLLVDLGYNGTVQDRIEPLLRRALEVEIAGRYLLLREQKVGRFDKKGLFDSRHYASTTLEAMCANVAVVEQLCTAAQGSVVDYDESGMAVRAENSIKARQSDVRDAVQTGCVRFAREREAAFVRPPLADSDDTRREAAAAILGRLMFLPLPSELEVLSSFEHDVNLGTGGTVRLFDKDVADQGLKRRGLFYMKGAERMYLPAELRGQGLPASLTLLTQHRFGLDLKYADFCDRAIELPIIVADGNDVVLDRVQAHATHDGWFMAAIPVGEARFAIGVQFGRLYDWVQVDSAQFVPVRAFLSEKAGRYGDPIDALPSLEGMEQVAPHLMRCEDASAFMMVPPPVLVQPEPMMLAIVFRPIADRPKVAADRPLVDRVAHEASAAG
ncbi:HAD family hydrolase [Sphingosinicella terrae]|uniref:HAD family hydrolase n=1 Tax=Sphingosinicella terrae TaxID=2172047 RepID=UPI000E0CE934|nr:HAD family hydrolase [Sphingosinicella terrae]